MDMIRHQMPFNNFYTFVTAQLLYYLSDILFILIIGMGVAGAGWATFLSQGFATFCCYIYIRKELKILHPHGKERQYSNKRISILLNNGVPMGLQFSITGIGITQVSIHVFAIIIAVKLTVVKRICLLILCCYSEKCFDFIT